MPRVAVELAHHVEFISVLNEEGELDSELEPNLDNAMLLKLYRAMLLGRRFDERMLKLQRQGRLGTFAPIQGQEASQLGAVAALRETDWMVPAFRETAAQLWRGQTMKNILLYYGGYQEAGHVPEGSHNMPTAIPVATQVPHAAGLAYAIKYRGEDQVAMAFFGDGATSEGDFHEALNFAGVFGVPAVFVCQNNQWAISVPRSHQTNSKTLAQKAVAYGLPGVQVDGNDVLAVYVAASEAVERARAGEGATLIENITYRLSVHTTADDPTKYRSEEEVEEWEKKDPIPRFQNYLKQKGLLPDDDVEQLEEEIKDEIRGAVSEAEEEMEKLGDPLVMFDHVYAEMPPYLQAQRTSLAKALGRGKEGGDG
jgi:pyruvate dehydrogenase E1 component alpha subunit